MNILCVRECLIAVFFLTTLFLAELCVSLATHQHSLVATSWGYSLVARPGLLIAAASLVAAHGLDRELGLSNCPGVCRIFPDQGSSQCPLLWQADS